MFPGLRSGYSQGVRMRSQKLKILRRARARTPLNVLILFLLLSKWTPVFAEEDTVYSEKAEEDLGTFDEPEEQDWSKLQTAPDVSLPPQNKMRAGSVFVSTHRSPLPSVRRVRLEEVAHNVADFRRKTSPQAAEVSGFVALPLIGVEVGARISVLARQAAEMPGRFVLEDPLAVPSEPADAEARLLVEFFPDFTRARLTLRESSSQRVIAADTVYEQALVGERELVMMFAKLWSRVGQSLGHLGGINWQNRDLLGLNVGHAVVQVGERLKIGRVYASRMHPSTGEVLSVEHQAIAEIEVLEVHRNNALAQLTEGPLLQDLPQSLVGMSFWRKERGVTGSADDRAGIIAEAETLSGVSPFGFRFQDPAEDSRQRKQDQQTLPVLQIPQIPGDEIGRGGTPLVMAQKPNPAREDPEDLKKQDRDLNLETSQGNTGVEDDGNLSSSSNSLPPLEPSEWGRWTHALLDPQSWEMLRTDIVIGQSWGILNTAPCPNAPCDRYSSFPSSVLNLIGGGVHFGLTESSSLQVSGDLNIFSGHDVEGYELTLKGLNQHHVLNLGRDTLHVVWGPEISLGNVETVVTGANLFHPAIVVGAHYGFLAPGLGAYSGGLEVSLADIFGGELNYELFIHGEEFPAFPEQVGAFLSLRRSSTVWSEIVFGVLWSIKNRPGG